MGATYDDLTALMIDLSVARASAASCADWLEAHGMRPIERNSDQKDVPTWDQALGELYARRASSLVREEHVVSFTWLWISLFTDGFGGRPNDSRIVQALFLGIGTPLCVPFDLIVIPTSFGYSCYQDMRVEATDRQRAMADLEQARRLGFLHPEWWMR